MILYPSLNGGRSSIWAPFIFAGKNIVIIGDSITFGFYSTDDAHRYSTLLTAALGGVEVNHGIGSSTMEKRTPLNPIGGTNMLDRLSDIPTKTSGEALLIFAFGMNDWGLTYPNYTVANFKTDYTTALNDALGKGWIKNQILIVAPTYPTDTAFTFYSGLTSQTPPTRQRMLDFQTACIELATEKDVNICLPYSVIEAAETAAPGVIIKPEDGVHPLNPGHLLLSNTIRDFLLNDPYFNFVSGEPRIVIAKKTKDFASMGIDSTNTEIIYKITGGILSFVPGRGINGISGFEANKGYYIIAKQSIDFTDILAPTF